MNTPTISVIFGITGDLAGRKLIPSFFSLWRKGLLPKQFRIVGFSRRHFTDQEIRFELFKSLPKTASEKEKYEFLSLISYKQGIFDNLDSYKDLQKYLDDIDKKFKSCSNKLFYLAVPPMLYPDIVENISKSGLSIPCGGEKGFARVLIEKPFGNDLKTAEKLDALLGKLFKENQVYRIDHYLGKETLQNILAFRFSNTMFEPIWNKKHIEKIEINLFEENSVEGRAEFYDKVGALKDVGQNHLLAILALMTMEQPKSISFGNIRNEREKVLARLNIAESRIFKKIAERAQYRDYLRHLKKEIPSATKSDTETYFKIPAFINNIRWKGVPFILTSGKAQKESKTEIKIYFKDPDPKSFLPQEYSLQEKNVLTFRIQPNEGISILFWIKSPGFHVKIEPRELSFNYSDSPATIPDAYERILHDCIIGDQTLFPTTKEIMAQWKFIESAILELKKLPLGKYNNSSPNPFS